MIIDVKPFIDTIVAVINHLPYQVLLWFIILDIATGIAKGVTTKRLDSTVSTNGMIRHVLVMFIVTLTSVYGRLLNFEWVATGIGYFL